jgi:hypothetical protein
MPWDTRPLRSPLAWGQREASITGHMIAPEPLQEGRPCSGPLDTWLHQSPPEWGGDSVAVGHLVAPVPSQAVERGKSYLTRGRPIALPGRELGPGAIGHVAACCCAPYFQSQLRACIQGYPVCRVPLMSPGPTSGDAANPQVGPTSFPPYISVRPGTFIFLEW